MDPKTVLAREGDVNEHIILVISGKIDCYRKIKESRDKEWGGSVKLSLEPRQGMQELTNVFGDLIVSKEVSHENPYKIGDENILLGVANTCSVITRSFVQIV